MTKQELHTAFGNWLAELNYKPVPHKVGIYRYGNEPDDIELGYLVERYLSHLENLLQDYE